MIRCALVLSFLALAGCTVTNIDEPALPGPPGSAMSEAEKRACRADGGVVERAGLAGFERCTRPYADAGKVCTDSRQCEGQCRGGDLDGPRDEPVTGTCQVNDNPFGCYSEVKQGRVDVAICVD